MTSNATNKPPSDLSGGINDHGPESEAAEASGQENLDAKKAPGDSPGASDSPNPPNGPGGMASPPMSTEEILALLVVAATTVCAKKWDMATGVIQGALWGVRSRQLDELRKEQEAAY